MAPSSSSENPLEDPDLQGKVNAALEMFDELMHRRYTEGEKEYGHFTFLVADSIEMAMEELVDLANYAKFTFVRLALINDRFGPMLETLGPASFIPGSDVT